MNWDDNKSTFDDRPNVPNDQKLTAGEWNDHVADQKGRVPYGPVAERPAAADAEDGDVWLVTDLANDAGVMTKVVSGSWEIAGIGDASNRVPVYASSVDADEARINTLGQTLDVDTNDLTSIGALKLRSSSDRVIYGVGSGLFVKRSYGEAATITKQWSPPESQGGKESTYALVVGDDDDYVFDIYNNSGYTSGPRAAQWGVSLKHQADATQTPFVIDFDNAVFGESGNTRRFVINPLGELELKNGPINITSNPIYGLREVGSQPTTGDLSSQEWAFTTDRDGGGTAAWLFKDSSGTVHYWDADGTL